MSILSPVTSLTALVAICVIGSCIGRWRWGKYLSAPAIIILLAMLASALGVLPLDPMVAGGVMHYLVPGAVALMLVQANLRGLVRSAGPMALLFLFAASATLIGGVVAFAVFSEDGALTAVIPALVATYIGGSVNFVAATQSLGLTDPDLVSSALAADAVVGVSYLVLLSLVSGFLSGPEKPLTDAREGASAAHTEDEQFSMAVSVLISLGFAAGVVGVASLLVQLVGNSSLFYLFIISISVGIANLFPGFFHKLSLAPVLGVAGMYVFFAVVGAATDISALGGQLAGTVSIAAIIVGVHVLLLLLVGYFLPFNKAELLTVSNACVLGPATAAAIASSRGWTHLVAAGTLCGVLGYVIANFAILMFAPFAG